MSQIYETISSTTKKLMFSEPFYGLFLIQLNKEVSETLTQTACVSKNGINSQLTINPKFWIEVLKDPESKVAVVKHELLHIVFFHLDAWDTFPDKSLANIAADIEVNQYIEEKWKGAGWKEAKPIEIGNYPELKLPPRAGIRKYYELLSQIRDRRKALQGQCQSQQQCQNPGQGQGQGQEQQNPKGQGQGQGNQQGKGKGQGQQDPKGQGNGGKQQGKGGGKTGDAQCDSKIWDYYDSQERGESVICSHEQWKTFTEGLTEAERKLIKKQIDHQLKEIANSSDKSRGTIPSELKEYIDKLFQVKEPVIDWKEYLRRFTGHSNKVYTKKSRRKLNKRFEENPALKIKTKKTLLVARDTSGSTSAKDHKEFFNELYHMWKTGVRIFVVDADAGVADVFEYKGTPPEHISGRGGTDFDPAIKYYNENRKIYNAFVYLTDGLCPAPTVKPYNSHMLWVISSGGTLEYSKEYPGVVVKIQKEQTE